MDIVIYEIFLSTENDMFVICIFLVLKAYTIIILVVWSEHGAGKSARIPSLSVFSEMKNEARNIMDIQLMYDLEYNINWNMDCNQQKN